MEEKRASAHASPHTSSFSYQNAKWKFFTGTSKEKHILCLLLYHQLNADNAHETPMKTSTFTDISLVCASLVTTTCLDKYMYVN